jgi:hypothetical protein
MVENIGENRPILKNNRHRNKLALCVQPILPHDKEAVNVHRVRPATPLKRGAMNLTHLMRAVHADIADGTLFGTR